MTLPDIVEWLDDKTATALVASGAAKNPESLGYYSSVPTVFDGTSARSWSDYIHAYPEQDRPYIEALRQVILARRFRASKYWMDRGERWVPRFADGTVLSFTSDGWSELQAAIWSEEEGVQYSFYDWMFAMGSEEPVRDASGKQEYVFRIYE
jgi:hypothetical protein